MLLEGTVGAVTVVAVLAVSHFSCLFATVMASATVWGIAARTLPLHLALSRVKFMWLLLY